MVEVRSEARNSTHEMRSAVVSSMPKAKPAPCVMPPVVALRCLPNRLKAFTSSRFGAVRSRFENLFIRFEIVPLPCGTEPDDDVPGLVDTDGFSLGISPASAVWARQVSAATIDPNKRAAAICVIVLVMACFRFIRSFSSKDVERTSVCSTVEQTEVCSTSSLFPGVATQHEGSSENMLVVPPSGGRLRGRPIE